MRERLPESQTARLRTIETILCSLLRYILILIGMLTILSTLGISLGPVLATAGLTGLAVGFGAQKLVRDVISGFFILLEDQFSVGEYVSFDSTSGTVEAMGMRVTHLRDEEGRLVIIANGDINRVTNHSRSEVRGLLEIGLAQSLPLEEALQRLTQLCEQFQHEDLESPPKVLGLSSWDANRYVFQIEFHATHTKLKGVQVALREHLLRGAKQLELPVA
jgi:small conductance mechanosensitive channel